MTTPAQRFDRWRVSASHRMSGRVSGIVQGSPVVDAVVIILAAIVLAALIVHWPDSMPWTSFVPLVILGGLFLPPRLFALVLLAMAGLLAYAAWFLGGDKPVLSGSIIVTLLAAAIIAVLALSRARLGVQGTLAESMLVDLRDQIGAQSELPALPAPWQAEVEVESAYGEPFSGDFAVAKLSDAGDRLEIALVDVSGKGLEAGTRALLLSGAFGSLLGAIDREELLGAANSYLLRQNWDEGFATAIHLALELGTGRFSVGGAGHPPAVKFWAGSGQWQVLDARNGPLLGVMRDATYPRSHGRLRRGDALLLYTDGVIETRTRDLTVGIDRMLGAAERLVPHGFAGGAARICAASLAGQADDRAVVLIWRD